VAKLLLLSFYIGYKWVNYVFQGKNTIFLLCFFKRRCSQMRRKGNSMMHMERRG